MFSLLHASHHGTDWTITKMRRHREAPILFKRAAYWSLNPAAVNLQALYGLWTRPSPHCSTITTWGEIFIVWRADWMNNKTLSLQHAPWMTLMLVIHTFIDDLVLVGHFCDIRVRSNTEVTRGLEKQRQFLLHVYNKVKQHHRHIKLTVIFDVMLGHVHKCSQI